MHIIFLIFVLQEKYPAEYFYYAGGVPAVMEAIKENLNLDVMTVTGKTLGEKFGRIKK